MAMTVCPVGQEASRLPWEARLEWMQPQRFQGQAGPGQAGRGVWLGAKATEPGVWDGPAARGWWPEPARNNTGWRGNSWGGGVLASAVGGWDATPVPTRSPAPGPAQGDLCLLPGRRDSGQVTPRSELGSPGGDNQRERPQAMLEHFLYASVHTGCRWAGGRNAEAQRGGSATQHKGGSPAGARGGAAVALRVIHAGGVPEGLGRQWHS